MLEVQQCPKSLVFSETPDMSVSGILNSNRSIPEIHFLRGLAILCVLLNHLLPTLFPNGFLGVDIFFVISGFVISLSTHKRYKSQFYLRNYLTSRITRILPPLVLYVFTFSFLISLLVYEPGVSLYTALFSLFGFSNSYLIHTSNDYFSQSVLNNPFVQTWSLSIELQFYAIFAIFILLARYLGRRLLTFIAFSLFLFSLLTFTSASSIYSPFAYYSFVTRLWQLLLGVLTFIILNSLQPSLRFCGYSQLFKYSALIAIILLQFPFIDIPSLKPLFTCLASSVFIFFSAIQQNSTFFLGKGPVNYIATISYSLYLWHWGVLSVASLTIGITIYTVPFLLLLSIILSHVAYAVAESQSSPVIRFFKSKTLFASTLSLFLSSLFIVTLGLYPSAKRFIGNARNVDTISKTYDGKTIRALCHNNINDPFEKLVEQCTTRRSPNTLWVLGDSHAESNLFAFSLTADDLGYSFLPLTINSTIIPVPPIISDLSIKAVSDNKDILFRTKQYQDSVLERSIENDLVLISIRFPQKFTTNFHDASFYRSIDKQALYNSWRESLKSFASELSAKGVHVILISPTPEFPDNYPSICLGSNEHWFNRLSKRQCSPIAYHLLYPHLHEKIGGLTNSISSQTLSILDTSEFLCPEGLCYYTDYQSSIYRDSNHFSNYGSEMYFYPALKKHIKTILFKSINPAL